MTKHEWIETAKREMEVLCRFIAKWHPGSKTRKPESMTITAPDSENIRRMLEPSVAEESTDPAMEFRQAIQAEDVGKATTVLQGAWFGVPESRACWQIPGFARAVDLMDDPPEEE